MDTRNAGEVQHQIVQRISEDVEFRKRLMADPKGVIEAETGVDLPDDALVFVKEAIAASQEPLPDQPLTEEELTQALGGVDCNDPYAPNREWHCPGGGLSRGE